MDRRNLEFFHAVVTEGSVSGAANALSITQPAVSKQISTLEKSLGLKLFYRTAAGMALTAAGKELLALGGDVLTRFQRIEGTMKERFAGQPSLRIAAPHTTASVLLAPFIAESNPPVSDLSIQARTELDLLLDGETDMAISTFKPPANRHQMIVTHLLIRVYGQEESMNSTFADSPWAELEMLENQTIFTPHTGVHEVVSSATSPSSHNLDIRSIDTGLIAQAFAANGAGFAIATETTAFGLQGRPAAFKKQLLFSPLYASWDAEHYAIQELENLALSFQNWMITTPPWADDFEIYSQQKGSHSSRP